MDKQDEGLLKNCVVNLAKGFGVLDDITRALHEITKAQEKMIEELEERLEKLEKGW